LENSEHRLRDFLVEQIKLKPGRGVVTQIESFETRKDRNNLKLESRIHIGAYAENPDDDYIEDYRYKAIIQIRSKNRGPANY
jgi:DNA gyrase inhibitor GyrI